MFAEALLTKAETNTWPKRPRTDEPSCAAVHGVAKGRTRLSD